MKEAVLRKSIVVFLLLIGTTAGFAESTLYADKVLVVKSERRLFLMRNGVVMKAYPIMLGKSPIGHKQKLGDNRTPEGHYILRGRNPDSRFHRSIHISYPNRADKLRARENGVDPGGYIAIHGLPVSTAEGEWDYIERDWTNGCIAVTNPAIEEIWDRVRDGTPIEIRP